jgi:hypothetical protein
MTSPKLTQCQSAGSATVFIKGALELLGSQLEVVVDVAPGPLVAHPAGASAGSVASCFGSDSLAASNSSSSDSAIPSEMISTSSIAS